MNKPHCFVKRICLISNFQTGRLYSASWQLMQVFSFRFTWCPSKNVLVKFKIVLNFTCPSNNIKFSIEFHPSF